MTDKQIINGIKYEKLTQDQLHDLSQWELVDIILAYRKDLKAKKKECKELKELNTRLDNQRETYWKEYQKLKQTITEIKELCKRQDLNQGSRCIHIIQKISEVLE